ncbi:MAG TPA: hypothetical protein PK765_06585 [bacterium]|nr:hypothetical protein [bacterium]
MSLDSFKRSPPEDGSASLRPKEGFQGTQTPDVFKFAQEYQAAKEISSRAELMSVLRDILDTREAGQCLRTGKWYVESATDGVWLSPIELAGKPDRPKSFLAYSKLDDFFTDAAVPSIVADAVDPNHQAAEAGKTVGKTIGESLVAKEKAETEKKAVALADILAQNPFTSNFHSFGDFVSSNANDFHATVRSGNLAFDGHPSRTDLVKKVQAVLPEYSDPHGKIHEEKREKLVSGEWVKETTRSLDRTIAKYEAMP